MDRLHSTGIFRSILSSKKKGLSRKLLIIVLLISSVFTFAQSSYQLYSDYLIGLSEIDQRFKQIFASYNHSVIRSIWTVDLEQTKTIASGILSLPNIEEITINEFNDPNYIEIISLHSKITDNLTSQKFQLRSNESDIDILVGDMEIKISLAPLYNDLYDKLLFILIFQTIKTFSVSILIFAAFHYLVTQHLTSMARFSEEISEQNLDTMLTLQRKKPEESDELDAMVTALNATKLSMKKMLLYNQNSMKLKVELDKKEHQEQVSTAHNQQIKKKNIELETIISELRATQEKLINSEKMAMLGNMVKGVAHELNTPIGVSITGVSHLQSETDKLLTLFDEGNMTKSALTGFLGELSNLGRSINVSLKKAAELIQSFKLVSVEQHEDTVSEFNVHQNFEDIVNSVRPSFKNNNIEIVNEIPADIYLNSFPGIFYQVYTNLLNNAALHAFEGADQGVILLSGSFNNNLLILTFSDNGRGMTPEIKNQLFDAFFTTKRGSGGTGLGMNIVYTLITEKLKGNVDVFSEVGKGTIFTITVPNL